MGKFDNGVSFYTFAETTIQIGFPEEDVKCKWCPFIKHYDSLGRDKCALTNDILYSKELRGHNCPLTILNDVKTEELNK